MIAALLHLAVVVNNVGTKIDRLDAAASSTPDTRNDGADDGVHGGIPYPAPAAAFPRP